jgi:cysteine-rich repeat protein
MRTHKRFMQLVIAAAVAGGSIQAKAADIGVVPTKLIVIDKLAAAGKAKTVFVAKDPGVTKGTGTDVNDISVEVKIAYPGLTETGSFTLSEGESNGTSGWLVNKDTVAKYVNKDAPTGPTVAKVGVIKPGNLVKLVAKDRGDSDVLDVLAAGAPAGDEVNVAYCVTNGGEENCHCATVQNCAHKSIAGGTGAKLVCKGGAADAACLADPLSCVGGGPNETVEGDEECDDGNVDPTDGCTNDCTECGNSVVTAPEECDDGNTTNGDGCDNNCRVSGCGNGLIVAPETCDDGNTDNSDACPSDCIVDNCDPINGSDTTVSVNFAGSEDVAGITVFLDYPEGKVSIPGSGGSIPSGIITDTPGFAFAQSNDLDHALRQAVVDGAAFPSGLLFNVHFEDCNGASAPTAGEFTCTVETAGDANLVEIPGVTCSVAVN